jgi:hypothetical protein
MKGIAGFSSIVSRVSTPAGDGVAVRRKVRCHLDRITIIVYLTALLAMAAEAAPAKAQTSMNSLAAMQRSIAAQQEKLQLEEAQLEQQALQLQQQQQLLDEDMAQLRGTGTVKPKSQQPVQLSPTETASATEPAYSTAAAPDQEEAAATPTAGAEQQQAQEQNQQQQTKVILQSSTVLTNAGGILTPKGQLVIDPSLEYDYWTQNQLNLNGFTIIPGITFGNIFISRVDQRYLQPALTLRYGLTNRWEINIKVPVVLGWGSTTAQAAGPEALPITATQDAANIGDVQIGTSYQFNSGDNGWPIFVGNFIFKTKTGQSPYEVPIYDADNTTNQLLFGIPKKLPTGTGFYAIEPSLTVFYATDPGVLFGNIQFIKSFSNTFNIPNTGGSFTSVNLSPGTGLAATFGLGFALNDKASMTLSYQEEHVFPASSDGHQIKGSAYDFGTFDFGLGYVITARTSLNVGVGIGVGPYAPAAKILIEVPTRLNIF